MSLKKRKPPVVRTPAKKIADARRIRFGSGTAPAVILRDAASADARKIRFGSGTAPAVLRK